MPLRRARSWRSDYDHRRAFNCWIIRDGLLPPTPLVQPAPEPLGESGTSSAKAGAERRWRRPIWHASPVSAAALRRVEIAIRDGYLRNDKDRKARPTKLIIDDPCSDFR